MQDLATALHLAGDYTESDKVCDRFRDQLSQKSADCRPCCSAHAENAYFSALAAEKLPEPGRPPARDGQMARRDGQALPGRRREVPGVRRTSTWPATASAWPITERRSGKAQEMLEAIPPADRTGDLAVVPYQLADILIRQAPAKADDAVAAGKLEELIRGAGELLDAFAASQPNSPQTPDALLKLGYCQQRLAGLLAQPPEQAKALAAARAAYEQLLQKYGNSPQAPYASFERAKVLASPEGRQRRHERAAPLHQHDPLKNSPIAPMALLELATLLRGQNQAAAGRRRAGPVPAAVRGEVAGRSRPRRLGAAAAISSRRRPARGRQAGRGAGRLRSGGEAGARPARGGARRPCVPASVSRTTASRRSPTPTKKLATPNLKPEEIAAATAMMNDGVKDLRDAVQYLARQAEQLKQKQPTSEARARMLYEAAWACRALADLEVEAARDKMQQDLWQKRKDEIAKKTPPGQTPPAVPMPVVPLTAVPLQPSETRPAPQYQALIAAFPDLAINADARFELAELLVRPRRARRRHQAVARGARQGAGAGADRQGARAARGRPAGQGRRQEGAGPVRRRSPTTPRARCAPRRSTAPASASSSSARRTRRSSCWPCSATREPFQNLPGLTDRALLRLGYALAQASSGSRAGRRMSRCTTVSPTARGRRTPATASAGRCRARGGTTTP